MRASSLPRWLPAVVLYGGILGVSAIPGSALEGTPGWIAVAGHAAGYAALGAAVHHGFGRRGAGLPTILLTVTLAVLNELQQGLVPGRSPDVADVAVDALGALGGVAARLGAHRRRRTRVSRARPGSRPPGPGSAARP